MIKQWLVPALLVVMLTAACGAPDLDVSQVPELEATSPDHIAGVLAAGDRPAVLNVWASWCGPCRSEAPLLRAAEEQFGDQVAFIGVDVRDDQTGARGFIAEFGLDRFPHYFDASGSVPASLGGFGVPLTFFFTADGTLVELHSGVIDERTLALQIDELLTTP